MALWVDGTSPNAFRLLLLDDLKADPKRTSLAPCVWLRISTFLRFPAPLDMIYIIGGRQHESDGFEKCLDTAEVFDWWRGEWVEIPRMSSARVGAAATVHDQMVVVAGGYNQRATWPLDTVEAFDPVKGQWCMLTPMPTSRYGLALASMGGDLFAIGGDNGRQVCNANEAYHHSETRWTQAAPMLKALAGGKADKHGGKIYYVGGCDEHEELSAAAYAFCPNSNRWEHATEPTSNQPLSLRIGRTSFAMGLIEWALHRDVAAAFPASIAARLLVTGGVSGGPQEFFLADTELLPLGDQASSTQHADLFSLNGRSMPRMPEARSGCRCVVLWPTPSRPFLPWSTGTVESRPASSRPFVVVLGGEAPSREGTGAAAMQPCPDPLVLDVLGRSWQRWPAGDVEVNKKLRLKRAVPTAEAPAEECSSEGSHVDEHAAFLQSIGRLRTKRVAFALTVAPGIPKVAAHGG